MVRAFDERRAVIVDELNRIPGLSCRTPSGAFYAFPNVIGTGLNARAVQDRLLAETHVATVAGTSFGSFGAGSVRFSYATSGENIRHALERVRHLFGAKRTE